MKAWPLLALLLAAPAAAGDLGDTTGIDFKGVRGISGKAPAPVDGSMSLRDSHAALQGAGIPVDFLIREEEGYPGWSVQNVRDIGPAIAAASRATCDLHARYPSRVADKTESGTLTNASETGRYLTGKGNLERGCISHQAVTFAAVNPVLAGKSLSVKKIRYGLPPTQHNAVIVFPHGTDWMYTGIVFDGWKLQKCQPNDMTYLYKDWGPIRPVGGVHVEPRYWKANVQLLGDDE